MDIRHVCQGEVFLWDPKKAKSNFRKHGISFEEACEVLLIHSIICGMPASKVNGVGH